MDEIFDRIRAIKIKRKYLAIGLVLSEILGIITLLWYLRVPLGQKFFTTPPKTYSVVTLNPEKRYVISQGDYLTGKAIPGTKVKILITPEFTKHSILADSSGVWTYQTPPHLEIGTHRITFGNFDKNNKLVTFQSYRFRVQSNVSIFRWTDSIRKRIRSFFATKQANAQVYLGSENLYASFELPKPTEPVQLTEDEKYRMETLFLPYAYPLSKTFGVDWRLMAMWVLHENQFTPYMDNCLDNNQEYGPDADSDSDTPCTAWGRPNSPNWQVGWGAFPFQTVDRLPEAIDIMRPGESIQQIGQRVIDNSRDTNLYSPAVLEYTQKYGSGDYWISNPEKFPDNVTLEQIIEGAKPLGGDEDRSRTCRPDDKPRPEGRADPTQDPKDCEMRQLLGILMKDPAISAYLLASMWKDWYRADNISGMLKNDLQGHYADLKTVSNEIAGIENAVVGLDLEALSAFPRVTMPAAIDPGDGPVIVESVVSEGGVALDPPSITNKNLQQITIVAPAGTNPQDFLCAEKYAKCPDRQNFEFQPNSENNVKGVSTIEELNIAPEAIANPQDYWVYTVLYSPEYGTVISYDYIPLDQIIQPSTPTDTTGIIDDIPEDVTVQVAPPLQVIEDTDTPTDPILPAIVISDTEPIITETIPTSETPNNPSIDPSPDENPYPSEEPSQLQSSNEYVEQ